MTNIAHSLGQPSVRHEGTHELFRCDPPFPGVGVTPWPHVVVAHEDLGFGPETNVYPAQYDGAIINFFRLRGSTPADVQAAEVFCSAGYTVR